MTLKEDLVAKAFSDPKERRILNSKLRRSRNALMRSITGLIWRPDDFNFYQIHSDLEAFVDVLQEILPEEESKAKEVSSSNVYIKDSFYRGQNLYIDHKGVIRRLKPRPELKNYAVSDEIQDILQLDRIDLWCLTAPVIAVTKPADVLADPKLIDLVRKAKLCERLTEREEELVNRPDLFTCDEDTEEINRARALTIMLHERGERDG